MIKLKRSKVSASLFIASLVFFIVFALANSRSIYISSSAAPGGDGSITNPYDSFSDINWTTGGANSIFDWVAAGDDVFINLKSGDTFLETLSVATSGVAGHPIVIQSYGTGALSIIDSENTRAYGSYNISKDYITFTGIHVRNSTTANIRFDSSDNTIINNMTFTGGAVGVQFSGQTNSIIDGCTISGTSGRSINSGGAASDVIISNNNVSNNGATELIRVFASIAVGQYTISGNTLFDSASHGLYIDDIPSTVVIIENNNISGSAQNNVFLEDCTFGVGSFFSGNTLTTADEFGIDLKNSSGIDLYGNIFQLNINHGVKIEGTSNDIEFYENIIDQNKGDALSLDDSVNDILIQRNIISNNGQVSVDPASGDGFSCHDIVHDVHFRYNIVYGNENSGSTHAGTSSGTMDHNTFFNNGLESESTVRGGIFLNLTGVYAGDSSTWDIKNNIISENYPAEIVFSAAIIASVDWDYNQYYHPADSSFASLDGGATYITWATYNATYEPNSSNSDPLLSSNGKITKTSPAVDTGLWIAGVNQEGQKGAFGKNILGLPNRGAAQNYSTDNSQSGGSRTRRAGGAPGVYRD